MSEQSVQASSETTMAYERGLAAFQQKQYDKAIKEFDRAITSDPNYANALYYRGVSHHAAGNMSRALADYAEVIRLAPDFAPTYLNRAGIRSYEKDSEGTIADLNECIRLDPGNIKGLHWRGQEYAAKQDYDRAAADYDAALAIDPNQARIHYDRAFVHWKRGDLERATTGYGHAVALGVEEPYRTLAENCAKLFASPRKFELLSKYLRPVTYIPPLRTVNSSGLDIVRRREDADVSPKFFGKYGHTFLMIPLKIRAVYLLSHPLRKNGKPDYMAYYFHGHLTPEEFKEIYPDG